MLGVALGCIGLSYDDFCRLGYDEFAAIWQAYMEQRDLDLRDRWERTRLHACVMMQPHVRKGHRLTPTKLMPLPWDTTRLESQAPKMTAKQQRKRMEELAKKLGDQLI